MGFQDRYSITEVFDNDIVRVSLSVDELEEGKITPVLMIVPNQNENDHDHISIGPLEVGDFKNFINTKGHAAFNTKRYSLRVHNFSLDKKTIAIEVYQKYQGSHQHLYTVDISMDSLEIMKDWFKEFDKYSQAELLSKYYSDLNRQR